MDRQWSNADVQIDALCIVAIFISFIPISALIVIVDLNGSLIRYTVYCTPAQNKWIYYKSNTTKSYESSVRSIVLNDIHL